MSNHVAAAAAKSLQSCLTLSNPTDGSPPGSPIPGVLQARTLEWVAIAFSNAYKWKVKVKSLSRFQLLATPRSAAYQAPPSMGFSRQEYWSGVPLPSPQFYTSRYIMKGKKFILCLCPMHVLYIWMCTCMQAVCLYYVTLCKLVNKSITLLETEKKREDHKEGSFMPALLFCSIIC